MKFHLILQGTQNLNEDTFKECFFNSLKMTLAVEIKSLTN